MKRYDGERPQNARIKINYSGKKPKVSFKYPVSKKESKTTGSMFIPIFMFWILLSLPLLMIFVDPEEYPYRELKEYDKKDYNQFVEYYTQEEKIEYYYNINNPTVKFIIENSLKKILIILTLFIPPFLIYFPLKKRWNKLFPDYQAFFERKKYNTFTKEDLKESDGKIYLELPVFNNIVCDFNATKDFSKYLNEFEIEEHKFEYRSLLRKKKKKQKNEFLWYARWYFKEKPKQGCLEVIYK